MREIPKIVQELKEIETKGGLGVEFYQDNFSVSKNNEEDHLYSLNTQILTNESQKPKYDSYNFQDLETFLMHCVDFLDLYPSSAIIIDAKGKIKYLNKKFLAWLGFQKCDFVDRMFFSSPFFSSENERYLISNLLNQDKENKYNPIELIFKKADGQKLTGLINVNPLINSQDKVIGFIIVITDITGLKIEEETNKITQFYKSILENKTIWFSVSDLSSNVVLWNKAAEYISGYCQNDVLGHNKVWDWLKLDTQSDRGLVTIKGHTKIDNTIISEDYETVIKRKDGRNRIISWVSKMLFDNYHNPTGTITIGKDITELKKNEEKIKIQNEELSSLNKNLEEKVKDRTNKINELLTQKNDFINQLGHDLKTPLTPLMVLLPIIKRELEKPDKIEIIDVLIRNTSYMKDLITKTIELAKLNSDMIQFSIESVNLSNEIDFVIKNNMFLFEEKHISIVNNVPKDIFVQADVLGLREILINIVTNSVKYSSETGGEISIGAIEQSDMIRVSIRDNGIGMEPEQIMKIFDEFYKADDSRHNLDSSGLGLNIAKRLVEKLKGNIWAESEGLGNGSTFFFTLLKTP